MNATKHSLTRLKSTTNHLLNWFLSQVKSLIPHVYSLYSWLRFLLIILFIVFMVVLFSGNAAEWAGQLIGIPEGEGAKKELLIFLGLSMGGVLLALQALAADTRAKAMEDTVKSTERGQRQERLKNAIEHLGAPAVSVRLGGIYELFHLAEDTLEWRQTILDILCAHIRRTTSEKQYQVKYQQKPSEEIQSMLTLLFVQAHTVFQGHRVNLEGAWLNGADLRDARLQCAKLNNTHLQGAHLEGARLQGAILNNARLQVAWLSNTWLHGADLNMALLQLAQLDNANLQGAYLIGANLQSANLARAKLQGAILTNAMLQSAFLTDANLQGVTSWPVPESFREHMTKRVGEKADFSNVIVIFGGLLSEAGKEYSTEGIINVAHAEMLRGALHDHVDKPIEREPPEDSGAITEPPYTQEDAERWIAEYEEAVSGAPKEGER